MAALKPQILKQNQENQLSQAQQPIQPAIFAVALGVLAIDVVGTWLLNGCIFSRFALVAPWLREASTLASGLAMLVAALLAWRAPRWLKPDGVLLVCLGSLVSSTLILFLAAPTGEIVFCAIAMLFNALARAACNLLIACELCALKKPASIMTVCLCGTALGNICCEFLPLPPMGAGILIRGLCMAVIVIACWRQARILLESIAQSEAPTLLNMTEPQAFLKPLNGVLTCSLFFGLAFGFSLALNQSDRVPATTILTGIILAIAAIGFAFSTRAQREDDLFSLAILLVIAGLAFLPWLQNTSPTASNALFSAGGECFRALIWTTAVAIGLRNQLALIPVLSASRAAHAIGVALGAMSGHAVGAGFAISPQETLGFIGAALFIFVAFLWIGFRSFSFSDTINGVHSLSHSPAQQVDGQSASDDALAQRCATIATAHGLTKRETEILAMMAQGRNARFIKNHYVVSVNTVKSHIKHVYLKLDIHSQQELIDLVRSGESSTSSSHAPSSRSI